MNDLSWSAERMKELRMKRVNGEAWNEDDWIDFNYIESCNAEYEYFDALEDR